MSQQEEDVDHLNYDVINISAGLCFDLCLPAVSEDDTKSEVESSKCLLSDSPGDGGGERTSTHGDGEDEMGGESIMSGSVPVCVAVVCHATLRMSGDNNYLYSLHHRNVLHLSVQIKKR